MKHHAYVVSDIHLGGTPDEPAKTGFGLCSMKSRQKLAAFIKYICRRHDQSAAELIINGDFLDFLAETQPGDSDSQTFEAFTTDPELAKTKLMNILRHTDQGLADGASVWDSFRMFLAKGHKLTILLGNHDCELSMPGVWRLFVQELTGGVPRSIQLLCDGQAYRWGPALIEHGNRYDGWNIVCHGRLRSLRAAQSRGEKYDNFTPPPGSRLVASVMNPLKRKYAFIDRLKPELQLAVPVLLALEPKALPRHTVSIITKLIEAISFAPDTGMMPSEYNYISTSNRSNRRKDAFDFTLEYDEDVPSEIYSECRKVGEIIQKEIMGEFYPTDTVLIGNVDWYSKIRNMAFDARVAILLNITKRLKKSIVVQAGLDKEDPLLLKQALRLSKLEKNVKYVVFGHTHGVKHIRMDNAEYFNTGSWCSTVRFPLDVCKMTYPQGISALADYLHKLADTEIKDICEEASPVLELTYDDSHMDSASATLKEFNSHELVDWRHDEQD